MSFWRDVGRYVAKGSNNPDWGVLERYLAWAFGAGASATGIVVNPQTAMQSAAVYACIKVLAESIGQLPIRVVRDMGDKGKQSMPKHDLQVLLTGAPNEWQTYTDFCEMIAVHLGLRGNFYAFLNRAGRGPSARIVEMLPLHPDTVNVIMGRDFEVTYQAQVSDGGMRNFDRSEILHIKGLSINGWLGISPIAYAREAIGLALATEKYGAQLFRNGAKMSGILEHPGKLGDKAFDRLKTEFDAAYSGENTHKTAILEEGMKYSKVSMTADDAQFLQTRKYQRGEIASIFRVPPHMIGDLERATFSNIEQQSLDFVIYSLMPWLVRIQRAFDKDCLSPNDRKQGIKTLIDYRALLRGDMKATAEYIASGVTNGWLTRNEGRLIQDFNPLPDLDEPLIQTIMTTVSNAQEAHDADVEATKNPPPPVVPPGAEPAKPGDPPKPPAKPPKSENSGSQSQGQSGKP